MAGDRRHPPAPQVVGPTAELDVQGEYDAQVTAGNLTTQIHVTRSAVDGSIIIESWQNK